MFEGLDDERASSFVVLFVAVVLVAGLRLEYARIFPNGSRIGSERRRVDLRRLRRLCDRLSPAQD